MSAEIDWERRYRHMRIHSCLHLLCAVIEGGVTGGSIGAEPRGGSTSTCPTRRSTRLHITAEHLNRLIEEEPSRACQAGSATEELAANPDLGAHHVGQAADAVQGRVRVLEIEGVDVQPCGGTHVARPPARSAACSVGKIENKGRHNRRVNVHLDDG